MRGIDALVNESLGVVTPQSALTNWGYYCVVTDTKETEKNYLYGLRESLPNDTQNKLNIQVVSTDTKDLFEEASRLKNLNPQYSQT